MQEDLTIGGTRYAHPSTYTLEQTRENTASVLERFARAHDKVAASGVDAETQRASAANARRAAARVRAG